MALECCHRNRDEYGLIWWLRADEEAALAADVVQLGRELGLAVDQMTEQAAQVALVRRWLEGGDIHWLLVFDNADTIAPKQLQTYLPRTGLGRVLITSRNPNWRGTAQVLAVNVFAPEEAIKFLQQRLGRGAGEQGGRLVLSEVEGGEEELLAQELGYLPLALEHAGAYVEATGCTLADYRRLLATQRARLWEKAAAPDAYHATITTTWEISFQQVRQKNPAAIALFNLCCFLAPEEIPLPLLREQRETLPDELVALLADDLALNEAIGELRRYSLLARDGEMLAVHRLVQTVALNLMPAEEIPIWADAALELIYDALPDWRMLHEWIEGSKFLLHMTAVSDRVVEVGVETKRLADLGNWIGYYLRFWGELAAAKPYYERALAILEVKLGPDHLTTKIVCGNLRSIS